MKRNRVFASNSNFLIPISLHPNVKFKTLDISTYEFWNQQVEIKIGITNFSLRLNSFGLIILFCRLEGDLSWTRTEDIEKKDEELKLINKMLEHSSKSAVEFLLYKVMLNSKRTRKHWNICHLFFSLILKSCFGFCNLKIKTELFLSPESHKHLIIPSDIS